MSDLLTQIHFSPRASASKHLTCRLREMILDGKMKEGYKFPSNKELSDLWKISTGSVQVVMSALTKEGLLERTPKVGTFVAKRSRELNKVGIYLWHDIWHDPSAAFRRSLVSQISTQLRAEGIVSDVWIDPRPEKEHVTPWPELVRAVEQRQIQAMLLPNSCEKECPWVLRLPVPMAEMAMKESRNQVSVPASEGAILAAQELARMGCRTVGMISVENSNQERRGGGAAEATSPQVFRSQAAELGMETCDGWFPTGVDGGGGMVLEGQAERFGYRAMKQLLAMPNRPEGVYACHDLVSRGALTAVLESRISVPEDLRLVLYRNKEIDLLCPVPATFVEFSVAEVAAALIRVMHAQMRGEEMAPIAVKPTLAAVDSGETAMANAMVAAE